LALRLGGAIIDLSNGGPANAHHYPRLFDFPRGPRDNRHWGVDSFHFGQTRSRYCSGVLCNGNRNDMWRPWPRRPCASLALTTRDIQTTNTSAVARSTDKAPSGRTGLSSRGGGRTQSPSRRPVPAVPS